MVLKPKAMVGKRNLRKYVILPVCLIVLNAVEEVLVYKTGVIGNDYLRTAVILALYLGGFGLVGLVLAPLIERWLALTFDAGRRKGGSPGVMVLLCLLGIGLFFLYFRIYVDGPETLLPRRWRNPSPIPGL